MDRGGDERLAHLAPFRDLFRRVHENVEPDVDGQSAERSVQAGGALPSRLGRLRDHQQVDVALRPLLTASTTAEQDDPDGTSCCDDPLDNRLQQIGCYLCHGVISPSLVLPEPPS